MGERKIHVLIVDDSAVVRQTLSDVLSTDPVIEVMGTAGDPFIAAERMREQTPDVITLDIEMPRMDGLSFLKIIMEQHPIPVVICSSLAEEGAQSTLKALEYGAVEIDVLFRSAALYAGQNAVGVIMTGMGDDGANGMLELKQAKAATIAQDEQSCVVFGMPNEAIKRNAVDRILPLHAIARAISAYRR